MKRFLLMAPALVLLAACGSSPSKSDAEDALNELAAQMGQLFGNKNLPKIKVKDLTCQEVNEKTFDCEVLLTSPILGDKAIVERHRFTRLDGKWHLAR